MRTINPREKKLIRYSAAGLGIYLALFFVWKPLQHRRAEYQKVLVQAQALRDKVQPFTARAENLQKLMEIFQLDPATLNRSNLVGEASSAIQKAAISSGIQVGAVRESSSRSAGKELASIQFEGMGQVPAVMGLLQRIEALGFPIIIDTVQVTPQKTGPGMVKLSLTIQILDFEQWKNEEKPNA